MQLARYKVPYGSSIQGYITVKNCNTIEFGSKTGKDISANQSHSQNVFWKENKHVQNDQQKQRLLYN